MISPASYAAPSPPATTKAILFKLLLHILQYFEAGFGWEVSVRVSVRASAAAVFLPQTTFATRFL